MSPRLLRPRISSVEVYCPADVVIPERLGGGKLKELVHRDARTREVVKYALVYVDARLYALDNGRVLDYDNDHGYSHKHFMGMVTPHDLESYEVLREQFEREWRRIAMEFVNGEI